MEHPVAIIGAGPVGLAAAAYLIARRVPVKLYEAGESVGANVREWGHVRLFSPWRYNICDAARELLIREGWSEPPADALPTGAQLQADYLAPLARTGPIASVLETGARVVAIGRRGIDKVASRERAAHPFALRIVRSDGATRRDLASAVVDATGTWTSPNPLGAEGIPARGEIEHAGRVAYGIPDVLGRDRALHKGRTTLVVGAGHSAANALIDLCALAEGERETALIWAVRGEDPARVFGGGAADGLAARGELGTRLRRLVEAGRLEMVTRFAISAIREEGGRLMVEGDTPQGLRTIGPVDRIVAATGQRPDLSLTRELRLDLDPWLESARALGPLIDPNLHSCGSVPPHGHRELSHPEPGFYSVGAKSYGRAPTFLMTTGYEQVRSIAAALAGDEAAADDVRLVLPETGVCSSPAPERTRCCGVAA